MEFQHWEYLAVVIFCDVGMHMNSLGCSSLLVCGS